MINTKNIKLSIIIPTRERSDTLFFTIKTIIEQDYDNYELIISDNASQDNTYEIVKNFKDKHIIYRLITVYKLTELSF